MSQPERKPGEVPTDDFVREPLPPAAPSGANAATPRDAATQGRRPGEVAPDEFISTPDEPPVNEEEAKLIEELTAGMEAAEPGPAGGRRRTGGVPGRLLLVGIILVLLTLAAATAVSTAARAFEIGRGWGWAVLGSWLAAALALGAVLAREMVLYLGLRRFERFRRLSERVVTGETLGADDRERFYAEILRVGSYLDDYQPELERDALKAVLRGAESQAPPVQLCTHLGEHVLRPLDRRVYALISREAFVVAGLVSISPFPVLDSAFVAMRGLGLIRRVAATYRIRPGAAGSVRLLRRVFGTALYANLSQIAVSGFSGRLAGKIVQQIGLATAQGLTTAMLIIWLGLAVQREVRPIPFSDEQHQAGMMRTLWHGLRRMLLRRGKSRREN